MRIPVLVRCLLIASWVPVVGIAVWITSPPSAGLRGSATLPDHSLPTAIDQGWNPDSVVRRNPFRIARRPSDVPFGRPDVVATMASQGTDQATPSLAGVVWASTPTAVIAGLPGVDGHRAMRLGDIVSGIRLARIRSTDILLVGRDRAWRLPVPAELVVRP